MIWRLSIYCLLIICIWKCAPPEPELTIKVFPGNDWEVSEAAKQNVDPGKLEIALDTLRSFCGEDGTSQTLIIRNGYIIFAGDSIDKVNNIYSSSKSVTSTVLGLLIEEGECKLDDPAHLWLPELDTGIYRNITLRHFTTMTSGYNAVGESRWDEPSKDWSWTPYTPGEPIFAAGTKYCYWDEAQMMLGRALTKIAGKEIKKVFQQHIGNIIGIGNFEWPHEKEIDGIKINNGCTNVKWNARQLARFGWLYLNKGNWNGQQLIDSNWVAAATQVQVPITIPVADTDRKRTNGSGSYGYNWWINAGKSALPDSPKSLYYASGFNNNMCFVIPEWNMVVVRMGLDSNPEEPKYIAYNRFFKELGAAVH